MSICYAPLTLVLLFSSSVAFSSDTVSRRAARMLAQSQVIAFSASSDLARTRHFYHDVLGLKVLEENSMVIVFDSAGTQLRVSKVDKPVIAPYTVLGWRVVSDTIRPLSEFSLDGAQFVASNSGSGPVSTC